MACSLEHQHCNLICHSHWDPQNAFFLGVDNDEGQLQKANKNVVFAELGNRIHLLKASSTGRKRAPYDHWNNVNLRGRRFRIKAVITQRKK